MKKEMKRFIQRIGRCSRLIRDNDPLVNTTSVVIKLIGIYRRLVPET